MSQIKIRLANHSYPVVVGLHLKRQLMSLLKRQLRGNRLFIFFDSTVYALYGKNFEKQLSSKNINYSSFVIPSGETNKSQATLDKLYGFLLENKISRTDFILACGGGVTTDLVGYTAATVLRGVKWGAISTTLLGMVDAAIGGKTGINHKTGKNLIGAFWQPSFVICDLNYLQTLPRREMIAGLGEILKYAGLTGNKKDYIRISDYIKSQSLFELPKLQPLVESGVAYKAKIVMADERENHQRMFLNFGHTFAHAIETTLGYGKLLHGETVIIGILAAVLLSQKVKPRGAAKLTEYEKLVKTFLGFVRYYSMSADKVLNNMKIDKKRSGQIQKFVLLEWPGKPFIVANLKKPMVKSALTECLALYKEMASSHA